MIKIPDPQTVKIKCQCGFKGSIKDLIAPEDDNDSIPCPKCGQSSWEFE
jgi:hypothetical protein